MALINVDHHVELLRQLSIKVMALQLGVGAVDDTDGTLQERTLRNMGTCTRIMITQPP